MIAINYNSGEKIFNHKTGKSVYEILSKQNIDTSKIAAIYQNNRIVSLTSRILTDSLINPIFLTDNYGKKIIFNTYTFLINKAVKELFPDKNCIVGHSLTDSIYLYFENEQISTPHLKLIKNKIDGYIKENLLIKKKFFSYQQLMDFLKSEKDKSTEKLIRSTNLHSIKMYCCQDYAEFQIGTLLDETKKLPEFELFKNRAGFVAKLKDSKFSDNQLLYNVFKEHSNFGKILNVNILGDLNNLISENRIGDFIKINESLQENSLHNIAKKIESRRDEIKFIFLSGPSSSGKTTTTQRLSTQLKIFGFNPILISLDDYYKPKIEVPKDQFGEHDFESIDALDIKLFKQNLKDLLNGDEVIAPIYNFEEHKSSQNKKLCLKENSIFLIEGLHALNPDISKNIDRNSKFNIYVSALTQLRIDNKNRISTRDNRLLRRLVRDHQFRKTSAQKTYAMWNKVINGENKYIFPYQECADIAFNSALEYEIAVLKNYAEPILRAVKPTDPLYEYSYHLQKILTLFLPINSMLVPRDSILREFIGGSNFIY